MLDDSCLAFVGRALWVRPNYGWGWSRDGTPLTGDEFGRIEAASFFEVRVERLFYFRGELRGIVGVVTSAEHPFSGLHVVAAEMLEGEHDFVERICRRYDVWLGKTAPTHDEWPRIEAPGVLDGYGTVGATRERIDTFWSTPSG